jgi:hypothetical protein
MDVYVACNRYVSTKTYKRLATLHELLVPNVGQLKWQNYAKTEVNYMNIYGYELGSWIVLPTEQWDVRHNKWSDRILTVWATIIFLRQTLLQVVMRVNVKDLGQVEMKNNLNCPVPSVTVFNHICSVHINTICYSLKWYLKLST